MLRVLTWPFRWAWRNRRLLLIIFGGLLLLTTVTLLVVNPNGVVWGFLLGEKFHDGRPASYWRKQFAVGWDEATFGRQARVNYFVYKQDGSPILCDFLTDPDVNVRRVSAAALRTEGVENPATVGPLAAALADDDPWVRGLAAEAIGLRGELARDHFPTLLALTSDPNERVKGRAESGAWGADPQRMAERAGWVDFRSDDGRFIARFPAKPTVTEVVAEDENWRVRYVRASVRTADGTFAIEYTDSQRAERVEGGADTIFKPSSPLTTEFLTDAKLSGGGYAAGEGKTLEGLAIQWSGTDASGHGVLRVTLSRLAPRHPNEPDWDVLVIDGKPLGKNDFPRVGMMRYFVRSFRPDTEPKGE